MIALVAAVACLGGAAYAATRPDARLPGREEIRRPGRAKAQGPPRPRFIEVPPAAVVGDGFQFRFHVPPPPQQERSGNPASQPAAPAARWRRFQCQLDGSEWGECSSPRLLPDLNSGDHSFLVRALSPRRRPGPAAHYRWAQLEPKELTIDPQVGSLEALMPGEPAQQLPVRVGNPNPVPIEVTSLTVAVEPDNPGCPGDPNFAVSPAGLTPAAPLSVPAGGSVSLPNPAAAAPTLALRERPVDQNACQGATVRLVFNGEARG